ncbi:hypothetical protein [Streptomyces sp. enrichment culture]|uniref:hypothetical protein n=1 Tax=Streptomyces sp. enrichment culture TaxID=1795815 RepID=UPI003F561734
MISTRRLVAAVGLAASVTGLAVPTASAADLPAAGPLNPVSTLDSLVVSEIPAEHKDDMLLPSSQLTGLNRLNDLNQLNQLTGLAAPVLGVVPAVQT